MSEMMRRGLWPSPTWQMETPSTFLVCPLGWQSTASWGQEPLGQHCIRYVRIQWVVQYMEERVSFTVLGLEVSKALHQIYSFEQIIQTHQLKQIRLPLEMKQFTPNMQVLHASLYFILAVQKHLWGEGSAHFQESCMHQISNYYITNKMNFEVYQYAYLCSCILSLPLPKTMHLVYYLVYARLASKPYINALLQQKQQRGRNHRQQTVKSEIDSVRSRSVDSRHFTVFVENQQKEVELLSKQLKKMLSNEHPQLVKTKKSENKRYFNVRKVYPEQEDNCDLPDEQALTGEERKPITIPLKVGPHDHSSVISFLKFKSSKTEEHEDHPNKKLQLRRQKFNEEFDCNRKYETMSGEEKDGLSNGGAIKMLEENTKNIHNSAYKIQRHPYEYFRSMASNIKSKNKELDFIRSACTTQNFRRTQKDSCDTKSQSNCLKGDVPKSLLESATVCVATGEEGCLLRNLKSGKENGGELRICEKWVSAQSGGGEGSASLVTRKACQLSADERLLLFNKKMKNKFKVQKYKEQYRQFLKTQMFERVRNIF